MFKVLKDSEIVLSQHPLYALEKNSRSNLLFAGGVDSSLFKIENADKKISDTAIPYKISGLLTSIYTLCYPQDLELIALGGGKGLLQLFNISTNQFLNTIPLSSSSIFFIHYQPLHQTLWVGLGNGELKIISMKGFLNLKEMEKAGNQVLSSGDGIQSLQISQEALRALAFHPSKPIVAIGGKDASIRFFDTESMELIHTIKGNTKLTHTLPVFSLAFSPDGHYLVSGSRDASIKIWDTASYTLIQSIPSHLFAVNHLIFHPTEPYFVSASMDKSIKVWGADDFKLYKILNAEKSMGHHSSVNRLAWIGNPSNTLVSVSDDKRIIFWKFEF